MCKPVLLTGFRPTGELHLGHYFSLIQPLMRHHKSHKVYVMIADLHALTELRKPAKIDLVGLRADMEASICNAIQTISIFVPTDDLIIFRQSDLKEYHLDLFFRLLMLSRHNLTYGNPVFQEAIRTEYEKDIDSLKLDPSIKVLIKEFIDHHPEAMWGTLNEKHVHNLMIHLRTESPHPISDLLIEKIVKHLNTRVGVMGLASYPILMAADILLYAPDQVLVGKDQSPHIQITNDLVKILNRTFDTSILPVEPMINGSTTLKGNDGVKMSKSLNNHLPLANLLSEDDKSLPWFMKMRTFPRLRDETGDPNQCIMHELHQYFGDDGAQAAGCRLGLVGCVDCKKMMNDMVRSWINKKRYRLACSDVQSILKMGKARAITRIAQNEKILSVLI